MENINIRVNVVSNLGRAGAEALAFQKAISKAATDVQRAQAAFNVGAIDASQFTAVNDAVKNYRQGIIDAATASGKYNVAQKTMTAETTRFNERLMRSKVAFRDVFGPQNRRMIRQAADEQMRLNKMQAVVWGQDALGRQNATLFTPKYLDNIGNARIRMGYYNEILHSVSQQTVNWGKNMQWTGRQLTVGFTVPVAMATAAIGKLGFEMDKGLTRIVKVYGDGADAMAETSESIERNAVNAAQSMARAYGIAGTEVLDVMGELAATGMEGDELTRMTEEVSRAATLGDMSTEETLTMLRTLREAYGLTSDDLKEKVNMFNAIENATSLTMQDIAEGMPRIAGIMQGVGVSIEESTVLLAAFKAAGTDVAEGANALKSIAFKAIAPTPTSERNFFELTGRSLKDIVETANGEFLPVMQEIARSMDGMTQDDKVDLISRVFGIHQGNRALILLQQLADGGEQMQRAIEVTGQDASEWAAAANKEVRALAESTSGRLTRAWQSMVVVFQKAGVLALEAITPIVEWISKLINTFDAIPDSLKNVILIGSAFVAAAGPLIMLIGLGANFIGMAGRLGAQLGRVALRFRMLDAESAAARAMFNAVTTDSEEFRQSLVYAERQILKNAQAMDILNATTQSGIGTQKAMRDALDAKWAKEGNRPTMKDGTPWDWDKYDQAKENSEAIATNTEKTRKGWAKATGYMIAGSTALMGIGMLTDNEGINDLAMKLMSISMLLPLISGGLDTVKRGLAAMGPDIKGAWSVLVGPNAGDKIKSGFQKGVAGAKRALSGLASFMMGPWGIAIGAAIAGIMIMHQKHAEEIERQKKLYEDLANTAKDLGDIYNFTYTTPIEREMQRPDYDPDSTRAAIARIEVLRQEKQQYVENLKAFGQLHTETSQQLTEALRQGQQVLAAGGSQEDAMRAARDAYYLISGSLMAMPAFKHKLALELDIDEDQLYATAETAARTFNRAMNEARLENERDEGVWNQMWFGDAPTEADKAKVRTVYQDIFDEAMAMDFGAERKGFITSALEGELSNMETMLVNFRKLMGDESLQLGDMWRTIFDMSQEHHSENRAFWNGVQDTMGLSTEQIEQWVMRMNEMRKTFGFDWKDVANMDDLVFLIMGGEQRIQEGLDYYSRQRIITARRTEEEVRGIFSNNIATNVEYVAKMARLEKQAIRNKEVNEYWKDHPAVVGEATEAIEEHEEAVESLTQAQQEWLSANRAGMEAAAEKERDVVRQLLKQEHARQDKVMQEEHQTLLDNIDARYDVREKELDAIHDGEKKALDAQHRAQDKALDAQAERMEKSLDARSERMDAALEAFRRNVEARQEAETKAFRKNWEENEKRLAVSQERRREAIEAQYDSRIEGIRRTIEAEQEAEELRQRIFEAERERINRLAELYNRNIDMNVAINTGDLDEAARIGGEMSTLRAEWSQDDASRLSADASDERTAKLEKEIELLEEQKKLRLEGLKDIEEAEKESLARRREMAEEALKQRHQEMDDEVDAQRKKNQKIIEQERERNRKIMDARKEALREQQEAESEALATRQSNQTTALNTERENELEMQRELNDANATAQAERHADVEQRLEDDLADFEAQGPKTMAEQRTQHKALKGLAEEYGLDVTAINDEMFTRNMNHGRRITARKLTEIQNDKVWDDFARSTYADMTDNLFGEGVTMRQVRDFIKTGKWPVAVTRSVANGGRVGTRVSSKHTGGIIGEPSGHGRVGKSGSLSRDEMLVNMQVGEGVIKKSAMDRPGMRELIENINAGRGSYIGDGIYGMAPLAATLQQAVGYGLMRDSMMKGMEIGMAKHEASTGIGVPVDLDGATLNSNQVANARLIAQVGRSMGATQRDIIIGLMTAMQESQLENINWGDRDSVGLFQQRPSQGWGTVEEIMNPRYAARQFFENLLKIKDRGSMPLWAAAQAVQRSAFPRAYAKWEPLARSLVASMAPGGGGFVPREKRWQNILKQMDYYRQHSDLALSAVGAAGGRMSGSGLGWERQWNIIKSRFPSAILPLGGGLRPNAVTASGWPSYHGAGRATDLVAPPNDMMRIFNWIRSTYGSSIHELYYSPAGDRQVRQGRPYNTYGTPAWGDHFDHVHWAMNNGGWVPGTGNYDKQHAVLTPKEHVTNSLDAQKYAPLLNLINSGKLRMNENYQNLGLPAHRGVRGQIDNSPTIVYDIDVNVESGATITEGEVRTIFNKIATEQARKKGHQRRNG